jgi:hypothetical protein
VCVTRYFTSVDAEKRHRLFPPKGGVVRELTRLERTIEVGDQIFTSWNLLTMWLQYIDGLRWAA